MVDRTASVLVDTNAIIESHRTGSWRALAGGYRVEPVEDCATETQTGFQRRSPEQSIVASELRASLTAVHPVSERQRAELAVRIQDITLDLGEESLWAHALDRIPSGEFQRGYIVRLLRSHRVRTGVPTCEYCFPHHYLGLLGHLARCSPRGFLAGHRSARSNRPCHPRRCVQQPLIRWTRPASRP